MTQVNDPLNVETGERGIVRLFSFDPTDEDMALLQKKHGLDRLLGVPDVNPQEVEVFPVSDLAEMGLADYLIEGCGIPAVDIASDRARLDAVQGAVMVVRSRAFHGKAETLAPAPDLTLIGAYAEESAGWTAKTLHAESAAPYSGVRQAQRSSDPEVRKSGRFGMVAIIVLVVLVVVYLLLFSSPFL